MLPPIATDDPTAPLAGVKLVMLGVWVWLTVKLAPLLATPFAVTMTFPVVALDGTVTTI